MKIFILKLISFLRNFVKGDEKNVFSTKRFAFLIQGAYYAILNLIGFGWFLWKVDYDKAIDLIYFNGWLVVIFGGFVTSELIARVITAIYGKVK